MLEPLTLAAFIAFVGMGLAIFLGFAWFALGCLRAIEKSSTKIEAGMERAISELGRLFPIIAKPANPEPDKFVLVQKLQEGSITSIEAQCFRSKFWWDRNVDIIREIGKGGKDGNPVYL